MCGVVGNFFSFIFSPLHSSTSSSSPLPLSSLPVLCVLFSVLFYSLYSLCSLPLCVLFSRLRCVSVVCVPSASKPVRSGSRVTSRPSPTWSKTTWSSGVPTTSTGRSVWHAFRLLPSSKSASLFPNAIQALSIMSCMCVCWALSSCSPIFFRLSTCASGVLVLLGAWVFWCFLVLLVRLGNSGSCVLCDKEIDAFSLMR
jgi:hypothetical protein